jgi:hypothetical protein
MQARDFPREPNTDPLQSLIKSSKRHDITMLHGAYFMNGIKMHAGDLDERWAQLERDTLQIAYSVLTGPSTFGTVTTDSVVADANRALAGSDLAGISGKLAARVVLKKLVRKLTRR